MMLLFGAKICINSLGDISTAAEYCATAIQLCNESPSLKIYLPRAHHYFAVCHSALAPTVLSVERRSIHEKALKSFEEAKNFGCNDYLFYYNYALEHAETRNIIAAKELVKEALIRNEDHIPSWILLVLLLTSQKLYDEASDICNLTLKRHNDIRLKYCSAVIDFKQKEYNRALSTLRSINESSVEKDIQSQSSTVESPIGRPMDDYSEKTTMSQMSDTSSVKKSPSIGNTLFYIL